MQAKTEAKRNNWSRDKVRLMLALIFFDMLHSPITFAVCFAARANVKLDHIWTQFFNNTDVECPYCQFLGTHGHNQPEDDDEDVEISPVLMPLKT